MLDDSPIDVLFVCLHGSAKSVVATAYCRQLAAERGFRISVASAGVDPDSEVSAATIAGLTEDGLDVPISRPRRLTGALLASSWLVISFGCDLEPFGSRRPVIDWSDVPAVSDGYAEARDVIVSKVSSLLDERPVVPSAAPKARTRGLEGVGEDGPL